MTDIFTKKARSRLMARIRSKDTGPELFFARYLRQSKIKYRRNVQVLGNKVDFRILGQKKIVFIHGCFWHGCKQCKTIPQTRKAFWKRKIESNRKRDRLIEQQLKGAGYSVGCIWEHDLKQSKKLFPP